MTNANNSCYFSPTIYLSYPVPSCYSPLKLYTWSLVPLSGKRSTFCSCFVNYRAEARVDTAFYSDCNSLRSEVKERFGEASSKGHCDWFDFQAVSMCSRSKQTSIKLYSVLQLDLWHVTDNEVTYSNLNTSVDTDSIT